MNIARMRQIGRTAFVHEEMHRLGFWPPSPEIQIKEAEVMALLRQLYDELARAQEDANRLSGQIATVAGIEKAIAEVRRKRIERVRAEREKRAAENVRQGAERAERDTAWRKATIPYLGTDVSSGLVYEGGDAVRVESLGLPALATAADIATAIGITTEQVAWLSYNRVAARIDHYHRFTIPKKRGGERVISSPKTRLRTAQSWMLETILVHLPVHAAATAFRPGLSIVDNAAAHAGRPVVIRVDLKDFFPSIGVPRVKALLRSCGYNEGVATVLALLATEMPRTAVTFDGQRRFVAVGKRGLPQGACTSPALANLVCRRLDARLTGASETLGFRYTRYADDLVFSHDESAAPAGMLLAMIRRIVTECGFTINDEKTVLLRPHERQTVTGLVVNAAAGSAPHPRVSREDLRRFRAFLHQCDKFGPAEMSLRIGQDALAYASGYLSFIHMVSPEVAAKFQKAHPWIGRRTE